MTDIEDEINRMRIMKNTSQTITPKPKTTDVFLKEQIALEAYNNHKKFYDYCRTNKNVTAARRKQL